MSNLSHRTDVQFTVHGVQCAAWFYMPANANNVPVIVMAHGVAGVRTMRLDAFAERFSQAGYACLVFDYRGFGDSEGQPRQVLDISMQQQDWQAAIDYARTLAKVDPTKIILWGSSFSGGHVMYMGAHNQVAAVISQCPFTDGIASALATDPIASIKVFPLAVADQLTAWLGKKTPLYVAAAGDSVHSQALMTAPDCLAGYQKLLPEVHAIPNYVAARFALHIMRYSPGKYAARIKAPLLVCVCDTDSVAPAKATLKHISHAPNVDVKRYPHFGHFDIYVGDAFAQVVADQIAFLQQHVPV